MANLTDNIKKNHSSNNGIVVVGDIELQLGFKLAGITKSILFEEEKLHNLIKEIENPYKGCLTCTYNSRIDHIRQGVEAINQDREPPEESKPSCLKGQEHYDPQTKPLSGGGVLCQEYEEADPDLLDGMPFREKSLGDAINQKLEELQQEPPSIEGRL